jgi:hypothetical protein
MVSTSGARPMKENRRNYYRVLHVQPGAPTEVIKASYRALMGPLRHHPDLGGDHHIAAMINEAYAVLSDPVKRREYDLRMQPLRERWRTPSASASERTIPNGKQGTSPDTQARAGIDPSVWRIARICPLCTHALPETLRANSRCTRCDSPLAPPPSPGTGGKELLGRRASARKARNHAAIVYPRWNVSPIAVRMRDLSMSGLSLHATKPMAARQTFRIVDPDFEAVALVVSCRPAGSLYSIHASLLTIAFGKSAGVFVSATA